MFKDRMALMQDLRAYASPKSRLTRMIRSGEVVQVRRGIFLDGEDRTYSLKSLANIVYGPSYISFQYALYHYGLIPERVTILTSALYNKNKNRSFITPVAVFYYYYVPTATYPYGVIRLQENDQGYLIATPEKALLDTLYKIRGITSLAALDDLLFEDWRLDRNEVAGLNRESLTFMAPLYRKKICMLLIDWLDQEQLHA